MLPPGGEGEIKVTLKPKGNHTQISKQIVVHSNDPAQPQFTLTMRGTLLVDVVAQPASVMIRDLAIRKPGSATFALQLTENSTAEIQSVTVEDGDDFSVRKIEADSDADATYEVRFRGRDSVGSSSTRVLVKTSGENTPELVIPVRASAALNLRYLKDFRFMRKKGALQERVLRISARHGDAPKIKKVEDPDGLLEIEVLEAEGPMASIRMSVLEDKLLATDEGGSHPLIVHTNDREEPRLELEYQILPESSAGKGASGKPPRIQATRTE